MTQKVSEILDKDCFDVADEFSCSSISNTLTSNQIGALNWGTTNWMDHRKYYTIIY